MISCEPLKERSSIFETSSMSSADRDDDHRDHISTSGRDVFKETSVGAQRRADETPADFEKRRANLTAAFTTILTGNETLMHWCRLSFVVLTHRAELGEDPSREGLMKTPQRAADALLFLTHGYQTDLTSENR
jgi:hypothetical protein